MTMTMRVQSVVPWIAVVGAFASWFPRAAVSQELTSAPRTLRFFYASSTAAKAVEIDVSHSSVLGRVVSLHVRRATIGGLLAEVQRQTGITFAYDRHFPAARPITLEAESITVAAALGAILVGTGVDVVLTPTGHVWLAERRAQAPPVQEGTIVGRVTDKQTGDPIIGATVALAPARQSVTTGSDGGYRFVNLSPGNYTLRARYIGYGSLMAPVVVSADQEVSVDFPLTKAPQQLEEVVTTGTVVPTEVKALPTPVSVITEGDIALQRPHTVQELFRQVIPGAVSWDKPNAPNSTVLSVRGTTTLAGQVGQMKIFLDGVEAAFSTLSAVDPNSIARVEVIRGPQAAAIYGSEAIGGVVQIFTKRGDPGLSRPTVGAEAALGVVQTPYADFKGVLRQAYNASVRGAGSAMSYNLGASYTHTADYLPLGEHSAQSIPSIYGGIRLHQGAMALDVSGRYYTQNIPAVFNPQFAQTGFVFFSKPAYQPQQFQNQTLGARLSLVATSWWQSELVVGFDRAVYDYARSQPRLTTPDDTLLVVFNQNQTRTRIGMNSSLQGSLSQSLSGSLTVGFDHWSLPTTQFSASGTFNTSGALKPAPDGSISASRDVMNNTGYFAQVQLGIRDALFLTAGMRAEENSAFGDSLGTPVSPRIGLSYVQPLRGATFKLRSSYGRSIRAPSLGLKLGGLTHLGVELPNPELGPERQRGWDAGMDVAVGSSGSLSVTYYDQTAEDLIQLVVLHSEPPTVAQSQNIGRVRNMGVEVEGATLLGPLELKAQYGYARSRIEELAPGYGGDLRVGDQTLLTPRHTAGASLTFAPLSGTTVAAGLTYVGKWNYYDDVALFRCLGGTGPCQATDRDYIVAYPSFTRMKLTASQQITESLVGFVSVDNLTNNQAYEATNDNPTVGRITTVGFKLRS